MKLKSVKHEQLTEACTTYEISSNVAYFVRGFQAPFFKAPIPVALALSCLPVVSIPPPFKVF